MSYSRQWSCESHWSLHNANLAGSFLKKKKMLVHSEENGGTVNDK